MSFPAPTFLTLPKELRLQIFRYVLDNNDLYSPPNIIRAYKLWWNSRIRSAGPAFYGTKDMSLLLCLNHQWYHEMQEVLYTQFTFRLHQGIKKSTMERFNTSILRLSPRGKGMIRSVMIGITLFLGSKRPVAGTTFEPIFEYAAEDRLRFKVIKASFPALMCLRIELDFVGWLSSDEGFDECVKEQCVTKFMDLVDIFEGGKVDIVLIREDGLEEDEKAEDDDWDAWWDSDQEEERVAEIYEGKVKHDIFDSCWEKLASYVEVGKLGSGSRVETGRMVNEEVSKKGSRPPKLPRTWPRVNFHVDTDV